MDLSVSEAIYGFVAWLTTQKQPITAGSAHDCAPWADRISQFCKVNQLPTPREGWQENLVYPSDKENGLSSQISDPLSELERVFRTDPEYAWAWQCNLAMAAYDEGLDKAAANRAAARAMKLLFEIDMTNHEFFHQTQT